MALPRGIGRLRHRVAIQADTPTADAAGQMQESWSTVTTVYASIKALSGRLVDVAKQIDARSTHEVVIRHNSSITTKHRLLFESRAFNVRFIDNHEEKNEFQRLLVEEIPS